MRRPLQFGKYLLLERINVGGMAEVFIAKTFGVEGFERILAIKRILPTMAEDAEFISMFIDEARISVQLNHANIVHIHELGRYAETYFIAMEYVPGRDLRAVLEYYQRQGLIMPAAQAVYIASRMCDGLDHAHRKKDARGTDLHIIHRDVSPQNILLSFDGEVKLIDFGIAKAAGRLQKTQAGILKGKFGYMSPEQVKGLELDRRADIFAVGVVLYEMLTGRRLFTGESDFSVLERVRDAVVPLPRQFNAEIPPGLEAVLMRALAGDREERYQWASDFQEDLMRFLVAGDAIYGSKHLGGFLRTGFAEEVAREAERMERFATLDRPDDMEVSQVVTAYGPRPDLAGSPGARGDLGDPDEEPEPSFVGVPPEEEEHDDVTGPQDSDLTAAIVAPDLSDRTMITAPPSGLVSGPPVPEEAAPALETVIKEVPRTRSSPGLPRTASGSGLPRTTSGSGVPRTGSSTGIPRAASSPELPRTGSSTGIPRSRTPVRDQVVIGADQKYDGETYVGPVPSVIAEQQVLAAGNVSAGEEEEDDDPQTSLMAPLQFSEQMGFEDPDEEERTDPAGRALSDPDLAREAAGAPDEDARTGEEPFYGDEDGAEDEARPFEADRSGEEPYHGDADRSGDEALEDDDAQATAAITPPRRAPPAATRRGPDAGRAPAPASRAGGAGLALARLKALPRSMILLAAGGVALLAILVLGLVGLFGTGAPRLRVVVDPPSARVSINGQPAVAGVDLASAPGTYLVAAEASGRASEVREVELHEDSGLVEVRIALAPQTRAFVPAVDAGAGPPVVATAEAPEPSAGDTPAEDAEPSAGDTPAEDAEPVVGGTVAVAGDASATGASDAGALAGAPAGAPGEAAAAASAVFVGNVEGAEVRLDGAVLGTLPGAKAEDLEPGRTYTYAVAHEGYVTRKGTFVAGKERAEVRVALERVAAPASKPAAATVRRKASPRVEYGKVALSSQPSGAAIYVDGKKVNRVTPVGLSSPLSLPVGEHTIVFKLGSRSSEPRKVRVTRSGIAKLANVPIP